MRNLSGNHALYVVVPDDAPVPIAVRRGERVASRVISPPGLVLRIQTGMRRITITVTTERLPPDPLPTPSTDEDDDPTTPRYSLSPHTRFLLASKFLPEGPSGPILGDQDAATLINRLRGTDEVSENAVMNAAKKARDLLEAHGIQGIKGSGATPRVRRELLAWGHLTEADARWLRDRL
ncbi:hypothetical protein [Actinomycetospora termitidis]|uniref:Uncharacterized protein n=1 Tax=Actinomycetospora termitidis TaxID=3053470 RepID=A0ABT7ME24_9PSEU|nr:hypothetical protein [Actinomycetospora sp. Odt1-22]MDL5158916.1 hypothetical protein [Actinomycetospora sp. Odt1-22]